MVGKLMADKGHIVRFVMQIQIVPSPLMSNPPLPGKGNVCSAFRQKGRGQRAQNNPYTKVACFEVAYSPFRG